MGLNFHEDAKLHFSIDFEEMMGNTTQPATVRDVKALGELIQGHAPFRVAAIHGMENRFTGASGAARKAFWKLCVEQARTGAIELPYHALKALFIPYKPPGLRDMHALIYGGDGSDSSKPWVQARSWLGQAWPGHDRLHPYAMDGLTLGAMFGAIVHGNSETLDKLLEDVAKEPPSHRARLLACAMKQWATVAVFHLAQGNVSADTLDTLTKAGADVNASWGQDKPVSALGYLSTLPSGLRKQEEVNRLFAIRTLLERGANWKDVMLDHMDEPLRLFIGNLPAMRRGRLMEQAQSTTDTTGPNARQDDRRGPKL